MSTINNNGSTGRFIEKKMANKVMSKVYLISFLLLFVSSAAMTYISILGKTEEFYWVGIVMVVAALPIMQWAFKLFWAQEKNRKARIKAARVAKRNGGNK